MLISRYDEKIRSQIHIPAVLRSVIGTAKTDLYYGPVYLTKEGELCSYLDDEYDHAFDFSRACQIIGDWLDDQPTYYYETWSECLIMGIPEPDEDPETGEVNEVDYSEYLEIDRRTLAELVCGSELSKYV